MNRLANEPGDAEQCDAASDVNEPIRCVQLSLGRLLRRAKRLVQSTIEARFGAADLNFTQWTVLDLVRQAGVISISDLAISTEITTGALSRVVEGLAARDLLARQRGVADRRLVMLRLTDAGRAKFEAIRPLARQRWDDVLVDFSAAEMTQLAELLAKFAESTERTVIAASDPRTEA